MKEMFDEYVRARTQENWKFWLVSFALQLTEAYCFWTFYTNISDGMALLYIEASSIRQEEVGLHSSLPINSEHLTLNGNFL